VHVRIDNFGGLVLTKDEKKGPFWTALKAENCDIQSGSIDVAYSLDPASEAALNGAAPVKTLYHLDGATFLQWADDIDIARSPLADNSSKRIYFTGEECPKATDFSPGARRRQPYPARALRARDPGAAEDPMIIAAVGGGNREDRAYVHTWVSAWGEESAPSSPSKYRVELGGRHGQRAQHRCTSRVFRSGMTGMLTCTVHLRCRRAWRAALHHAGGQRQRRSRPGDRISFDQAARNETVGKYQGWLVSAVSNVVPNTIDIAANMWDASPRAGS
jgi:hypothetical protein